MKGRISSVILLTLALSWTALAQMPSPMREGNWEITMKMSMPGMKMDMPPMKQTQCITAAMAKDVESAMPKGAGSDCKFSDHKVTGSTASYKMVCTKPAPTTATAEMTFKGRDEYTGTMTIDSSGKQISMAYEGKRLGDCPK
ncbi:MAG TPA: DUF3617 family protein [Vicinamibacterales bacterium]|nr:DUF3617 family protein [Vicinamibacterales bacterium]